MSNVPLDLEGVRALLKEFVDQRDWNQFHSPKNLATALSVEASELLEPFQWLRTGDTEELTTAKLAEIRMEMADVFAYLLLLADKLSVDLVEALAEKIKLNGEKYPIEKFFGNAKKYNEHE
jgi:NTP pyrophosphatase (non-canonical NTP hydrolase)